ncbi:arsenical pump membrane protein [uncultured archaeon]|nr:arsenical pump membrane protein [uncultured archaeon]
MSLAIFALTLFLVIKRPYGIGIGYSALLGAGITLALGITTFRDVEIVWGIVWNATFTLVAIIIASLIFDEAGFFEYLAVKFVRFSKGSGRRLFVFIILLGALISAFFANDGTALVLTPIVYSILVRIGAKKEGILPFIMATGFIADAASMPFVVSNLVNIVTASYFSISFLEYSIVMLIPDLVAILSSIAFLWIFYRKSIITEYDHEVTFSREEIRDPLVFRIAAPFIIILVTVYALGGAIGIPVALISVPAVAILTIISIMSRKIDVKSAIMNAPWQIVLFSLGMYIIVFGMGREGVTVVLANVVSHLQNLPGPLSVLSSGLFFALVAALMNNMPSVMIINLSLSHLSASSMMIYTNVIANDIGPKFTVIGSLATLLWIHSLEKKKVARVSGLYYTKVGLAVGLPVLSLTLISLWLTFLIIP